MADHYGDESQSASDQEELVGNTDLEDELTDFDDVQFSYCKQSAADNSVNGMENGANDNQQNGQQQIGYPEQKSKILFFGATIALFLTAFALLICFPLYLHQLSIEGNQNNAYGAILYLSSLVTVIFIVIAAIVSYFLKWNIKLFKVPMQWKR